ncbi:MAG: hypothetical protein PVI01_07345 [Gemmatimonadales bacterium]|jgi:hypothetical protein
MPTLTRPPLLTTVALVLTLMGCHEDHPLVAPEVSVDDPSAFVIDGTVRFLDIEGGCWGIFGDDGVTYEPMGIPREFLEDGLKVRAAVKLRPDLLSTCMIGTIVEVLEIKPYTRG